MLLFRNGYLPFPYVIGMLPFAALTLAGVADQLLQGPLARDLVRQGFNPIRSGSTNSTSTLRCWPISSGDARMSFLVDAAFDREAGVRCASRPSARPWCAFFNGNSS